MVSSRILGAIPEAPAKKRAQPFYIVNSTIKNTKYLLKSKTLINSLMQCVMASERWVFSGEMLIMY